MQDTTTYKGFTISRDPRSRAHCPWYIDGLRRYCRDIAHAQEIIDHHLTSGPARVGGLKVVSAVVEVRHGLSASACRNRIEQASAQHRSGGKFAKRTLKATDPVTGTVNIPFSYGGGWDGGAA